MSFGIKNHRNHNLAKQLQVDYDEDMPKLTHLAHSSSGFTLIEILVTLALISIVFTLTLTNLNPGRFFGLGNDSKRKDSVGRLRNVLASYYVDKDQYPAAACDGDASASTATCCSSWQPDYITGITPTYLGALPHDPQEPAAPGPPDFCYSRGTTVNTGYKIEFRLENKQDPKISLGEYVDSGTANGKTYYRYQLTENWSFP